MSISSNYLGTFPVKNLRFSRSPVRTILIAALLFWLGSHPAASRADADPNPARIKFGALLTLSGGFAAAGDDCRKGIEAALSEGDNGRRLEVVFADSKNEATSAISEFKKMAEIDGVSAVYVNRAAMAMPINPISKSSGVPLLGAVGHDGFVPGNDHAFQVWPSSQDEGLFLAQEFLRRGYKKTALVYSQDEWTRSSANGFRAAYTKLGGTIVLDESVLTTDTDFRSLLLKVKEAAPDSMYFTTVLPQIAPIFKQVYGLHIPGARFTNFYVAKKDVLEAAGSDVVRGISYYDIQTPLPHLHDQLKLDPQVSVPALTAVSYVATILLAQSVTAAKSGAPADLFDALQKQTEVRTRDFTFPIENRYVKFPLQLKTLN